MSELCLTHRVCRQQIDEWAKNPNQECVYAVHTPWWSLYEDIWMPYKSGSLPVDPRGSVLMQGNLAKFWEHAKSNPAHYGKHGIEALVAAFHSNVEVLTADGRGWQPTSLKSWDEYNNLLDRESVTTEN